MLKISDCPYLWFSQAFTIPTWWFEQTQVTLVLCKTKIIHLESLHSINHSYQLELEIEPASASALASASSV